MTTPRSIPSGCSFAGPMASCPARHAAASQITGAEQGPEFPDLHLSSLGKSNNNSESQTEWGNVYLLDHPQFVFAFREPANLSYAQLVIQAAQVSTRLEQTLSSSHRAGGQTVNLSVRKTFASTMWWWSSGEGATVFGTVSLARRSAVWGDPEARLHHRKVRAADGEFIPLRYTRSEAGRGRASRQASDSGRGGHIHSPRRRCSC